MSSFSRNGSRDFYMGRDRDPWSAPEAPGRSTATARLPASTSSIAHAVAGELRGPAPVSQVQAKGDLDGPDIHALAAQGMTGSAATLPFLDQIQRAFGHHDVSGVAAHVGGPAADASAAMNARAYAAGDAVAFASSPDLHTAAHEAAHVVQQRGGVRLAGGVGAAGDQYERHADEVADAVVRGDNAEALLDRFAHRGSAGGPAQRDAHGNGGDRTSVQMRQELQERSRQHEVTVTEDYQAFRAAVERWLASQVQSRTRDVHRERPLVAGSNLEALHARLVAEGRTGQTLTLIARLVPNGEGTNYERVAFSVPGLPPAARPPGPGRSPPAGAPIAPQVRALRVVPHFDPEVVEHHDRVDRSR